MSPHKGLSETGGTNAFEASKILQSQKSHGKRDSEDDEASKSGDEEAVLHEDAQGSEKTQSPANDRRSTAENTEDLFSKYTNQPGDDGTSGRNDGGSMESHHNSRAESHGPKKPDDTGNYDEFSTFGGIRERHQQIATSPKTHNLSSNGKMWEDPMIPRQMTPTSSPFTPVSAYHRDHMSAPGAPANAVSVMFNISIGTVQTVVSRPVDTDFRGFYGSVMMSINPQNKRQLCDCQYCNVFLPSVDQSWQLYIYDGQIDKTWKHVMKKVVNAAARSGVQQADFEVDVAFTGLLK